MDYGATYLQGIQADTIKQLPGLACQNRMAFSEHPAWKEPQVAVSGHGAKTFFSGKMIIKHEIYGHLLFKQTQNR